MGATFTTASAWMGTLRSGYQTADKVANAPVAEEGFIWRRKHHISDRYRLGQGLMTWETDAGDQVWGAELYVTNGPDVIDMGTGIIYMVTANDLVSEPQGSGLWRETHVAEGFSPWEQWEIAP